MALLNFDISTTPATPLEPAPAPKPRDVAARKDFGDHLDRARRSGNADSRSTESKFTRPAEEARSSAGSDKAKPRRADQDQRVDAAEDETATAKLADEGPKEDIPTEVAPVAAEAIIVTPVADAVLAEPVNAGEEESEAATVATLGYESPADAAANQEQAIQAVEDANAAVVVEPLSRIAEVDALESVAEVVQVAEPEVAAKPVVSPLHAKAHHAAQRAGQAQVTESLEASVSDVPSAASPRQAEASQAEVTPGAAEEIAAQSAETEAPAETPAAQPAGANAMSGATPSPVVAAVAPSLPQGGDTASSGAAKVKTAERIEPAPPEATLKQPSSPNIEPAAHHPPRLPVTLGPHGKSGGDESGGLTEVQRVRLVQRVARAFQTIGDSGNPLRLRLSPPELGSLRLEITMNQGQMTARVEAETEAARTVLLDNLPALRERLAQQDIKIARFDVDLFGQTSGGLPQNQDRGPAFDDGASRSGSRGKPRGSGERASIEMGPRGPATLSDGRLNVII